ncbi:MAG: 4Fe-4S binding protein [Victivallales bacterium]|jgi:ferredoxin
MISSADIKKHARSLGADLVGIGNIERWKGSPRQMDPLQIMPECRSVIVCGFRVMRGSLRGVEEGTMFSNYASMGYGGITYIRMPPIMWGVAGAIEDAGYEAMPLGQIDCWRSYDDAGKVWDGFSRPVAEGKAAPDVSPHTRVAAYLAGLGEFGWSKVFLNPKYGPRVRYGLVLTELELEPDPIYQGPKLCNQCMACARECPANAISSDPNRKDHITFADGSTVEWGEFDAVRCCNCFSGGEIPEDLAGVKDEEIYSAWLGLKSVNGSHGPFYKKPNPVYWTGQAVCGGKGCVRACMMSLEARGVIENTFHQKFRRRKAWSVDWSAPAPAVEHPVESFNRQTEKPKDDVS